MRAMRGKINHDRHRSTAPPDPYLSTRHHARGRERVAQCPGGGHSSSLSSLPPGSARAGTHSTQSYSPRTRSLSGACSPLGPRRHPTHPSSSEAGYPRIFPGAQADLASPRGRPRPPRRRLHLTTPTTRAGCRTPHREARRPASASRTTWRPPRLLQSMPRRRSPA